MIADPNVTPSVLDLFGVNGKLLLAQVINFGIIAFVLAKWVFKPLLAAMDTREQDIKTGLKNAEQAKRDREHAQESAKKIEREARAEAKEILAESEKQAKIAQAEQLVIAKEELDRLQKEAQMRAQAEHVAAMTQFRREAAELVLAATKKVANKTLNESEHRDLVSDSLKEMAS